jgi:hypothetical protein
MVPICPVFQPENTSGEIMLQNSLIDSLIHDPQFSIVERNLRAREEDRRKIEGQDKQGQAGQETRSGGSASSEGSCYKSVL